MQSVKSVLKLILLSISSFFISLCMFTLIGVLFMRHAHADDEMIVIEYDPKDEAKIQKLLKELQQDVETK